MKGGCSRRARQHLLDSPPINMHTSLCTPSNIHLRRRRDACSIVFDTITILNGSISAYYRE